VLDWTYGTIHAVHLKPSGASYVGEYEDFVFGNPLPVTDAIVGHDGAFYFSAGGRGTRSSLYRVTYHGTVPTDRVDYTTTDPNNLRALRNQLEQWHGDSAGNLAVIFANLSHEDRFVRYAARIALEFQDLKQWRDRALATQDARAVIQAMIALARRGTASDAADVMNKLLAVDAAELSEQDRLAYYRAIQLTFVRLGKPEEMHRQQFIEKLDPLFPAATNDQNAELAQLLVYLQAPSVVAKTLHVMDQLGSEPVPGWGKLAERNAGYGGTVARMLENMPPVRGIHYAFVLRNALSPWTIEERRKYFGFFLEAAQHPGGASFPGFLTQMREDALSNVPAGERVFLDELAGRSLVASFESTPPQGPGRKWTTAEAVAVIGENLRGRNYDAGRNLFHATSCAKCHRYNAEGGAIGPDLSTAGRKFALADLLDAIVDPSKVISDQYGSHNIVTADGQVIVGRAVEYGDQVTVYTADVNKPPVVLSKEDIEEMTVSKVSQMPTELVDGLNENELKDLVAYLLSGGDRNAAVFRN
jgi:putative heme-binding domain-containing protein